MTKLKMTLQEFADRYGLPLEIGGIPGPWGEIILAHAGWTHFGSGVGYQKFNPVTQAEDTIKTIGLPYIPPPEPNRERVGLGFSLMGLHGPQSVVPTDAAKVA